MMAGPLSEKINDGTKFMYCTKDLETLAPHTESPRETPSLLMASTRGGKKMRDTK